MLEVWLEDPRSPGLRQVVESAGAGGLVFGLDGVSDFDGYVVGFVDVVGYALEADFLLHLLQVLHE